MTKPGDNICQKFLLNNCWNRNCKFEHPEYLRKMMDEQFKKGKGKSKNKNKNPMDQEALAGAK